MKYHHLFTSGNGIAADVLFTDSPEGASVLRPMYRHLACPGCGRVDELKAIDVGIDPQFRVRSTRDMVGTGDLFHCFSQRLRDVLDQAGVSGIRYMPTGRGDWYVVRPVAEAPTDEARAEVRRIGDPCSRCGRVVETVPFPWIGAMTLPDDPRVICTPSMWTEKTRARMCDLLVSDLVLDLMRKSKVSGVEWTATAHTEY